MVVVVVLVVLVAVALVVAAHWYVWRRLVRDTTRAGGAARRAGTVAAFVLPVLAVGAQIAGRSEAPFLLKQLLAWPGYLWLAVLMYLLLALLVGEAVRPLLLRYLERRAQRGDGVRGAASAASGGDVQPVVRSEGDAQPAGARSAGSAEQAGPGAPAAGTVIAGPDRAEPALAVPSRRLFVSRVVGGAVATAAAATVGYGTYGVLRGPRVKRVTVPLAKLPRAAHGYRIAVVSDIHLGPILGRAHTQRIVDTINSTRPDLIAVVGDLVDGSVEDLGPAAVPLAGLEARHGAFFVTGNHEYFSGAQEWVDHVRELGLRPLVNERVEIAGFDLAGVNDIAGESEGDGPDFAKALGDRDRGRASVLLAHQPIVIHDAVRHGVDLQLSGHTHGGQLWPGNYFAELANPTVAGLERYGDTQLYVTRGAGAWGPPVRVGAPSDITVVELASRQA
ncbi:metallophosphoesterase [Streptomyces liangshanensis]|uniref:Metallophosphoesterase n=1 Tax=Streptomyces liangshanensis TaxID=2717324 RepID=A0A6G9GXV4_9ACTN|nr:metallophosphoesterase [Streptomyces liangshanensis]QIQ03055.1 metallophosphoesterase [Streptomyces liangshanensis]